MSLDLSLFSSKVRRYRDLFNESLETLAKATGISESVLHEMEEGKREPTGDEVLILADHFKCDFKFFISNDLLAPIDETEKLFRAHSSDLTASDRWAIQEFLFLCENEAFLLRELGRPAPVAFQAVVRGNFRKAHGVETAAALRRALAIEPLEVPEIFKELRRLGLHVFRRRLDNDNISGLFIKHPTAGPCVLVNYDEDIYRQRFTAAHEGAHALFDQQDEYVVSFSKWRREDLREVRANAFAGAFLVPGSLLNQLPSAGWSEDRLRDIADQLGVNVRVLLIALERENKISKDEARRFESIRIPRSAKEDPELPGSLTPRSRDRRKLLLERGISNFYADLCFEAYQKRVISAGRLAEALLVDQRELRDIAALFGINGV